MTGFSDQITNLLERALALRLDRTHLLAGNIANADTPGYIPVDMRFEEMLSRQMGSGPPMASTSERHFSSVAGGQPQPELFYDPTGVPGLDGNAVNLDREMAKLAENTTRYNATARALQKKLAMLRYAVNEGVGP